MKKFRIDLHVHTNRYSPCAETLIPEFLGESAEKAGLDGVVITEHDAIWSEEEVRLLQESVGDKVKIYRGVEVSSADGHFVVIGLQSLEGIRPGISAVDLYEVVSAQNAVAILAHPQRSGRGGSKFPETSGWHESVDAVEVASSMTYDENELRARTFAEQTGRSMVAGSDAHCLLRVGATYTEFDFLPVDETSLAEAIKAKKGTPRRGE
ncbi:MAG: hypothetical protein C0622_06200 [Desulfuromonas sp.]|nr:MAG: hypothetical protein C0622_06200 [Desulfuromonas sp.]